MLLNNLKQKITRKRLLNFIGQNKSDLYTLDLGCGSAPYKHLFPNRVGFDNRSGESVDVVGDAHKLPFKNDEFDVVLCSEVLEHLHSPEIALLEMKRVLKSGGILILTTRFIYPIHDAPNDYWRFTKYGLRYLLKDWEITNFEEESSTTETIVILWQRIMLQTNIFYWRIVKWVFYIIFRLLFLNKIFISQEYGDITHKEKERNILCSGYYLIARKK